MPSPSSVAPRSFTTTLAPSAAKASACARPRPRPPPVTMTTRPSQIPIPAPADWRRRSRRARRGCRTGCRAPTPASGRGGTSTSQVNPMPPCTWMPVLPFCDGGVGGHEAGGGDGPVDVAPAVEGDPGAPHRGAGDLGAHEACRRSRCLSPWNVPMTLAELLALLGVRDRQLGGAAREADAAAPMSTIRRAGAREGDLGAGDALARGQLAVSRLTGVTGRWGGGRAVRHGGGVDRRIPSSSTTSSTSASRRCSTTHRAGGSSRRARPPPPAVGAVDEAGGEGRRHERAGHEAGPSDSCTSTASMVPRPTPPCSPAGRCRTCRARPARPTRPGRSHRPRRRRARCRCRSDRRRSGRSSPGGPPESEVSRVHG